MKKILLSCACCLLALGLVTACNNDEEVVENDDGNTQESDDTGGDTGSGGDTGTGSGGSSSEPITLENYVVSFSFVDEDGVATTLGGGYSLYLQGSWAADEQGYWDDEWIECSYDQATGYYTGTFTSIKTGSYEYKGVSCLTEEGGSWSGTEVVTSATGGNATLVVSESDGGGQVIPVTLVRLIYLSNYTLSFTFSGETIPDYAALYITGDFNGWALDALTEVEGAYTYILETISVGSHSYKVIACYADDEANWNDCVEVVTDEWGSDAKLEVVEASGDDYTHAISYEITNSIDFTTLQPEILTNVTLSFTFYATDGVTPLGIIPEGYQISVAGSFALDASSNWELTSDHVLTEAVGDDEETPTGAYTYTIASITSGTYEFEFLYDVSGEQTWTHSLTTANLFLKIGKGTSNSTIEYDVVTAYDAYTDIIHVIDPSVTSDFYIVLLNGSEAEITADSFSGTTITLATSGSYFTGASQSDSNYLVTATVGTATTSGTTYLASPVGNAPSWTNDWFTFYVGSWDPQIACSYLEIPATETGTCAVYVAYANLNILFTAAGSWTSEGCWDGYWVTNVADFDTFIATL